MISIVIPPVSDCFMPTLGAAQIVGFLRQHGIRTKLYDLGAELQNFICNFGQDIVVPSQLAWYRRITADLFTLENNGFKLLFDNFISRWNWRLPDTYNSLLDLHKDLLRYIELLPSIEELSEAQYVGFSLSFECQMIPSLLIAYVLKARNHSLKTIFGGSLFYNYSREASRIVYLMDLVDCLVIGPGEDVLLSLAKGGFESLDTTKKFRGKYVVDVVGEKTRHEIFSPDFSDINFSKYFVDNPAFPYMINSTCYYGRCKFCNGDGKSEVARNNDIDLALRGIFSVIEHTEINNVYIVDAALSPRDMYKIASINMLKHFSWIANARFDTVLNDNSLLSGLKFNGCRMLRFGLETASQRLLDFMNKGTNIRIAESIIKNTHRAGILNHVYLMFGYWTESDEDRDMTIKFLDRNKNYIDSYSISIFQPVPDTPVFEELSREIQLTNPSIDRVSYERIVAMLYKSEEYYKKIMDCVEEVKRTLSSYAHTNEEYYSANIFNNSMSITEGNLSIQFTPKDKIS